ncbi:MAG: hypothetical protein HN764_12030 [Gammaproteobacteria bacterium]|jgi:hypothetical protein|nr:hypothetical protein [Gammaproteobacteria bacterium]
MKIEFEKDIVGFQEARKLKMILEHYAHSDATDKPTLLLIESVLEQIESFISDPKFESLTKDTSIDDSAYRLQEDSLTFLSRLIASLRSIIGPTKKEMLLSKQRQELLERAERAESMAFDALAETVGIARERDGLQNKIKQQEQESD